MNHEVNANYLRDLGDLVKRAAREARTARDDATREGDKLFEGGRLIAYCEIISLMQQQAAAFGLGFDQLALDDIDPEHDLL